MGQVVFRVYTDTAGSQSVQSSGSLPIDPWSHITARYDGSELRLFINGVIDPAVTTTSGEIVSLGSWPQIGRYNSSLYHFHGYLDDINQGARPYDPYIGRFTQRDPIGDGWNWYVYAYNNPLKFIDPLGLRPVNGREEHALNHTFGTEVGGFLIDVIDVQIQDLPPGVSGQVPDGTKTVILLDPAYTTESNDPLENLNWLSVFIHEAVHIWQRWTQLHRDESDYEYEYQQLWSVENLGNEEHATAVQDWFYVTYGLATDWLTNPLVGWSRLGTLNLDVADFIQNNPNYINQWPWREGWWLDYAVRGNYARVIDEMMSGHRLDYRGYDRFRLCPQEAHFMSGRGMVMVFFVPMTMGRHGWQSMMAWNGFIIRFGFDPMPGARRVF